MVNPVFGGLNTVLFALQDVQSGTFTLPAFSGVAAAYLRTTESLINHGIAYHDLAMTTLMATGTYEAFQTSLDAVQAARRSGDPFGILRHSYDALMALPGDPTSDPIVLPPPPPV
jgi:hypothetical protein